MGNEVSSPSFTYYNPYSPYLGGVPHRLRLKAKDGKPARSHFRSAVRGRVRADHLGTPKDDDESDTDASSDGTSDLEDEHLPAEPAVSPWLLRDLPRANPARTLQEFHDLECEDWSLETKKSIFQTLASFPIADFKHLEVQDQQYLAQYVWDLWMLTSQDEGGEMMGEVDFAFCKEVEDVIRLHIALLEGKAVFNFIAPETVPLLTAFVRLHRLGFITDNSQPEILDRLIAGGRRDVDFRGPEKLGIPGKMYVCRQSAYVSGYMPYKLLSHAIRFVETHWSRRVRAEFRIKDSRDAPMVVGFGKERKERRKRFAEFDEVTGRVVGPWTADTDSTRYVDTTDRFGFMPESSASATRDFEHYEKDGLPESVSEAFNESLNVKFNISVIADDKPVDLSRDMVDFFSEVVPPAERIVGDATTVITILEGIRAGLKAQGVDVPGLVRDRHAQYTELHRLRLEPVDDESLNAAFDDTGKHESKRGKWIMNQKAQRKSRNAFIQRNVFDRVW